MNFQQSLIRPRVGRPSLKVKLTSVRLPDGADKRIEALVGKKRMAIFIREAVEEKLQREEKARASASPS